MPYARPCVVGQAGKLFIGVSWLRRTVCSLLAQPTCTSRQHSVHLLALFIDGLKPQPFACVCTNASVSNLSSAAFLVIDSLNLQPRPQLFCCLFSLTSYCLHARAWCTDAQDFAQCKIIDFFYQPVPFLDCCTVHKQYIAEQVDSVSVR